MISGSYFVRRRYNTALGMGEISNPTGISDLFAHTPSGAVVVRRPSLVCADADDRGG